jgi:hypothetical protein
MKTALTELIEKWDSEMGSYIPNAPIYQSFIQEAKCFLEKEKQQIIEAATHGANFDKSPFKNAQDYYDSTFGDNIEAGI